MRGCKMCGCCGKGYVIGDFLALPPACGGGYAGGMYWRNCSCGSTLVLGVGRVIVAMGEAVVPVGVGG